MKKFINHSPLSYIIALMAMVLGVVQSTAQLPVRTRQVQLFSNNNANYTILRSADGQTVNWSLIQPPTVGTTGSIQLSTVAVSDAQLSWLAPGAAGYMLGISGGIPAWVDPATYLNGSFWSTLGNTGTNPATQYLGTTDATDFVIRTNATEAGRFLSTGELRLASLAGAVNATVPVGYDRFLVADNSGNVDQVEYAAVINQNAWSLLGNTGTNPATNYLGTADAQPLVIRTNAAEAMRVLSTGQIGIGTATPGELLEIEDGNVLIGTSAAGTAGALRFEEDGASGNNYIGLQAASAMAANTTYTLPDAYPVAANYVLSSSVAGVMSWQDPNTLIDNFWSLDGNTATNPATQYLGTTDATDFVLRTNATEAARFLSTGELRLSSLAGAVNATVPVGYDRFLVADNSGNVDQVEYAAVINQYAWSLTGNTATNPATNYLGTADAQPLVIRTNAAEAMRVLSTGQVGIGTATPGELLEVEDGNVLISTSAAGTAGALRFEEDGASGSNYVGLQAPSALAANTTYTLPDAYPAAANYVMASSVAGVMSWQDPNSLVDNFWSLDGNTGTNPATQYLGTTDATDFVLRTNATEAARFLSTGELRLASIAGAVNATVPVGYDRFLVADNAGNVDQVEYAAVINQNAWSLTGNTATNPATNYLGTADAQPLVIRTNAAEAMRVLSTGQVGIGTATPGELFEVEDGNVVISTSAAGTAGALRFEEDGASGNNYVGLQAPSALAANTTYTLPDAYPAAANYVMASSVAGVMSWQDPNTLVDNFWSLDGNTATNPATQYLGTTDATDFVIRTNATEAVRILASGQPTIAFVTGVANASVPPSYDRVLIANPAGLVNQASFAAVVGTTAWTLTGNSGTSVATNFVGTTDNVGLVFRTNNVEVGRFNATGEFGLGTVATAGYTLHVGGVAGTENVRMASLGAASVDPVVVGNEGIVTADNNGDLRRRSTPDLMSILGIGRGIFTPVAAANTFLVPTTGFDLTAGATVTVTIVGPSGPSVHAMVTNIDPVANTITVGTSATIDLTYAIHWMIINP